ncbi:hypothetical protein ACFPH8_04190 [Bizionia hallyeonensis]|uniref:Uncharacterized protein n=1 Tax=Bizionia hallyeonensis TaxID=1123757 RepID=A0ABW0C5N0_9FLAO|nr:hypothetical protein [Bizionia sp. M204]UPS92878.1 hypothetical protein GMA17_14600 [Bizionia sp. M204]
MQLPTTFTDLIDEANHSELYQKLIQQLNKDLALANVDLELDLEILPTSLKFMLHEMVYKLIQEKFMDYLNLLYIIDVSETKVRELDGSDTIIMAEQVAFLVLQREWQKVWFKNRYS